MGEEEGGRGGRREEARQHVYLKTGMVVMKKATSKGKSFANIWRDAPSVRSNTTQ